MTFPKEHRVKLHSTNPLERLNGEIKRRTNVVGIFPNEAAMVRMRLSVQRPWRMIRRPFLYVRSTSNTGNQTLECLLPEPKPT